MSFPVGPLDTQSHSLPSPSQTKHPDHCCNRPGIDTAWPHSEGTRPNHKLNQNTLQQINQQLWSLWGGKCVNLVPYLWSYHWGFSVFHQVGDEIFKTTNPRTNSRWCFDFYYWLMNFTPRGKIQKEISDFLFSCLYYSNYYLHFKPKQYWLYWGEDCKSQSYHYWLICQSYLLLGTMYLNNPVSNPKIFN